MARSNFPGHLLAVVLAAWPAAAVHAGAGEFTVVIVNTIQPTIAEVMSRFEKEAGLTVDVRGAARSGLKVQVRNEDHPDIVFASEASMNELVASGAVDGGSRATIGRVGIGVAIAPGAAVPDLSSVDAARQTVLKAQTLALADPQDDPGGAQAQAVLVRLGASEAVKAKTRLGSGSNPLASVCFGEVEIGLQPVNEILATRGLKLAGPLPAAVQQWTRYDVAVIADAPNATEARQLLSFLKSAGVQSLLRSQGFEPAP